MAKKINRGHLIHSAIVVACCGYFVPSAVAQSYGGTGLGGQSQGGASAMSGMAGGGSGATSGSAGMFGSSRSLGGGSNAGNRSLTGNSGGNGQPQGAALDSNSRFLRQNRQGQFVGQDQNSLQNFVGALGGQQQGRNNRNMQNLRPGAGNRQQNANNNRDNDDDEGGMGQNGVRKVYHPTLTVDFDYPTPQPAKLSATLQGVMSRAKRLKSQVPYEVSMEGRTAVLRGEVGTSRDRTVAEKLALLEPGVSKVQNELTVREGQVGSAARSENLKSAAQGLPLPPPAGRRSSAQGPALGQPGQTQPRQAQPAQTPAAAQPQRSF